MSIVNSSNYSSYSPLMVWATADGDLFNRTHVANTAQTLESHVHGGAVRGQGLSVLNLNGASNTNTPLAQDCDVFIGNEDFTYRDSSGNNHTLLTLDIDHTITANETFSGNTTFSGTLTVPKSAGANPTTSGQIAYDTTSNSFRVGINGADAQIITTAVGSALGVANGGTGRTSLTAHSVIVGEGTSAVNQVGPGTSGFPLLGGGGSADPSFGQLTSSGIAAATITGSNIAANTITAGNLAAGSVTSSALNTDAATGNTIYTALVADGESANGNAFRTAMHNAYNNAPGGDPKTTIFWFCVSVFGYDPTTTP